MTNVALKVIGVPLLLVLALGAIGAGVSVAKNLNHHPVRHIQSGVHRLVHGHAPGTAGCGGAPVARITGSGVAG